MKLYTRGGDRGETGLFLGVRVPKHDSRVEAYGTVDELNAALGWARSQVTSGDTLERLRLVSEDLFAVGSSLSVPPGEAERAKRLLPALPSERIGAMEAWIDQAVEETDPLRSFVLPGGGPGASALHVARTVCRRAERRVVALAAVSAVDDDVVRYLNRLADYLFAAARLENKRTGETDVEWRPKRPASGDAPSAPEPIRAAVRPSAGPPPPNPDRNGAPAPARPPLS